MPPELKFSQPEVPILMELHDSLTGALERQKSLEKEVNRQLTQGFSDLLNILGIPAEPAVSLTPPTGKPPFTEVILRLYVNGSACRYPDELVQKVYWYIQGKPLGPSMSLADILQWLTKLAVSPAKDRKARADLVDFLKLISLEIVKRQPAVLLGQPQLETYVKSLPDLAGIPTRADGTRFPQQDWLRPALAQVLNLRISIADTLTVNEVIGAAWKEQRSWEDAAEDLMVALQRGVVEIHLPLNYMQAITSHDSDLGRDFFSLLREGLFNDDGLKFPDFRFVPVEHLKPAGFVFQINHLPTTPRVGLTVGEYLVNARVDELANFHLTGQAATNPANLSTCSIIASTRDPAEDHPDLYSWSPVAYLVLACSADLRENYASFVNREIVRSYLDQLDVFYPALVQATQEFSSLEDITRVLRHLLSERVPIRNLKAILSALIEIDYIVIGSEYIVFDRRLALTREPEPGWQHKAPYLTSYVRQCLNEQISQKFSAGRNTLTAFLLDPEIEDLVSAHDDFTAGAVDQTPLTESTLDLLLTEVQRELERTVGTNPPDSFLPAILTTGNVRQSLRQLLAPRFPRLPVLAYQELALYLNIHSLGRIGPVDRKQQA